MKNILCLLLVIFCLHTNSQNINTIAGNGTPGYAGDGTAAINGELNMPKGVFVDGSNNVFISDTYNHRIRKVNGSTGIITTIAGNGTNGYSGDGAAAINAELSQPSGVFLDGSGNVFIADAGNNRIRKISASTGIITTIAGTGTAGYTGDGSVATSAELDVPYGVFVGGSGNVFIADFYNYRIRKVNGSTGIITTIAGNGIGTYAGDGAAAINAQINRPKGVFVDGSGNVFIADTDNNRVRKVSASTGIITTVAGNGTYGYAGDGSAATSAELYGPSGVFVDGSGNLLIAEEGNLRIRKVSASTGIITTIAGNGMQGYAGDGAVATNAELNIPFGVFVDGSNNVFIADTYNNRIRKVDGTIGINDLTNTKTMSIYPNPTSDQFFIYANTTDKLNVDLYDVNGRHVFSKRVSDKSNIDVTTLNEGVYTMIIKTADRVANKKLVIAR